ncbi:MAG: ABC transporter permease [Bacteroidetes bacterium]|nr:ABC transporter permease [Bacteroidota bacterium]
MNISRLFVEGIDFLSQLKENRNVILELTKRDFSSKYIKNIFGLAWSIFDPLAFIIILYLVFGFRYGHINTLGVPYITYLITGYISYELFSTTLMAVVNSIKEYSFLIRKVNFRIAILPIVKILSSLMLHAIIVIIAILLLLVNKIQPSLFWIQLLYYIFCFVVLITGLAWLTSSINLFFPDIKNIISIINRVLFFLTPIFWNIKELPKDIAIIMQFNPLYYIVNGYRDSLLFKTGFWEYPVLTLYFWTLTFIILIAGILVFKKLRPHFADVT